MNAYVVSSCYYDVEYFEWEDLEGDEFTIGDYLLMILGENIPLHCMRGVMLIMQLLSWQQVSH